MITRNDYIYRNRRIFGPVPPHFHVVAAQDCDIDKGEHILKWIYHRLQGPFSFQSFSEKNGVKIGFLVGFESEQDMFMFELLKDEHKFYEKDFKY